MIPSFQDCLRICEANPAFKHKQMGPVHIFNYGLATHSDFESPIPGEDLKGHELRGLSFVEDSDSITRYLSIHKFFNLNQTDGYMYGEVCHKDVVRVQTKWDGSMIRFLRLPSGEVVAKTKYDMGNRQTEAAERIYLRDPTVRDEVDQSLSEGTATFYEYLAPTNRIVVRYEGEWLQKIQERGEVSGHYVLDEDLPLKPLSYWVDLASTLEGEEGWVITLDDGQMLKVKTQWYLDLHHLLTEDVHRPDWIIQSTLNETIDDALSAMDRDDPDRASVETQANLVTRCFNEMAAEVEGLLDTEMDRKGFAIQHKEHPLFSVLMASYGQPERMQGALKQWFAKRASSLTDAESFMEEMGARCG